LFAFVSKNDEANLPVLGETWVMRILGWGVVAKLGHERPVWDVNLF
jgi:hypothetical protein